MKKKLVFLATTLLLANHSFANPAPITQAATPSAEPETEAVIINSQLKVISKTQKEEDQTLNSTIEATYPQIVGTPLSAAANNFNQQVMRLVTTEVNEFKNNVKRD